MEEYYLTKYKESLIEAERLRAFVELVATGKRPDGTYNYCREALEKKAKELLDNYNSVKSKMSH